MVRTGCSTEAKLSPLSSPKLQPPTPTPQQGMEEDNALTQVSEEVLCHLEKSLQWRKWRSHGFTGGDPPQPPASSRPRVFSFIS